MRIFSQLVPVFHAIFHLFFYFLPPAPQLSSVSQRILYEKHRNQWIFRFWTLSFSTTLCVFSFAVVVSCRLIQNGLFEKLIETFIKVNGKRKTKGNLFVCSLIFQDFSYKEKWKKNIINDNFSFSGFFHQSELFFHINYLNGKRCSFFGSQK